MSKSIRISPKHGLNPTIPICPFCGKERQEIAIMGRVGGKEDIEMPMYAIIDFEPCDECKAAMDQGITLIMATQNKYKSSGILLDANQGMYFEGHWAVIKEEGIKRAISDKNMLEQVLKARRAYLDEEAYGKVYSIAAHPDEYNIAWFIGWCKGRFGLNAETGNMYESEYGEDWELETVLSEYIDETNPVDDVKTIVGNFIKWCRNRYGIDDETAEIYAADTEATVKLESVLDEYIAEK